MILMQLEDDEIEGFIPVIYFEHISDNSGYAYKGDFIPDGRYTACIFS